MKKTFWIYKTNIIHLCTPAEGTPCYRALYRKDFCCNDCKIKVPVILALGSEINYVANELKMNTYIGPTFMASKELPVGSIEIELDESWL